ncbi:hypothetical protein ACS0TY_006318 [Phlomoides rotata]
MGPKVKGFATQVFDLSLLAPESDAIESKVHGCFALSIAGLEKLAEKSSKFSCLKIEIYRRTSLGTPGCGFVNPGKLLGGVVVQLDLKTDAFTSTFRQYVRYAPLPHLSLSPTPIIFRINCPIRVSGPVREPVDTISVRSRVNCSLCPSFTLMCNSTKAYLTTFLRKVEVLEINPSQIRIEHSYLLTASCYNTASSVDDAEWHGVTMSTTQYMLSDENWLTAIGCDDLVLGIEEDSQTFGGSDCVSYCKDRGAGVGFCPDNSNGLFGGDGCCRAPIPRGLTSLVAQFTDLKGKWQSEKLFRCSYAFIQEKGVGNQSRFSYPLSYLNNSSLFMHYDDLGAGWKTSLSLVIRLDWRIGAENCSQERWSSNTFACRDNSACVDFAANVGGYHCRCLEGYQGNPYLPQGCKDIDECVESRTNPCDKICINTPGNVSCSCLKGYYGDGRKGGTGCIRMPYSSTLIWLMTGLGSVLGFLLFLAMCFWLNKTFHERKKQMRKQKLFKRNGGLLLQQQTNDGALGYKTKLYSAEELETATDHFNESRILGEGGQGTVYKGMLSDGSMVAIKKSKVVDDGLLEQFINEVVILSQIKHRNVVKLLGCCLETDVPLLVYELLPNGTLFDLIHDPATTRSLVSWSMRLKIATDIAGALAYLHSASSVPIYHRDIKSQNFLLDEKYVVKIADFGISRSIEVNQTHLTTMVKGTFGYLDPEYLQSRQYSEKSEVYSFGVVLAELLTGKRPIFSELEERLSLVARFVECAEENRIDEIIDPQILEQYGKKEEVSSVAKLAHRCLNSKGKIK